MAKVLDGGDVRVPDRRLTFEEFLDWCDEDVRAEWVEGRVVLMSPENIDHQRWLRFLVCIITHYVEWRGLGEVFFEGMLMRLGPDLPARQPDLIFVAKEHADRVRRTYIDGPADLVVEVVSPDSQLRDRAHKFGEYAFAGVREFWLLDPDMQTAEFYALEDGHFRAIESVEGVFRSLVLDGFWIKVDWLWNPPALLQVLREWGISTA